MLRGMIIKSQLIMGHENTYNYQLTFYYYEIIHKRFMRWNKKYYTMKWIFNYQVGQEKVIYFFPSRMEQNKWEMTKNNDFVFNFLFSFEWNNKIFYLFFESKLDYNSN